MKKFLVPVVASLCGMLLCASSADATAVFVHNRPIKDTVTINNVNYVPFNELMDGLHFSWSVDEQGNVVLKQSGQGGVELVNEDFTLLKGDKKIAVDGIIRDGAVWVPIRLATDLGYGITYNPSTGIVDVLSARMINDNDRKIAEEISEAQALKEAKLAEEAAAAKVAYEERKQAMSDLKAKKAGAKEGSYDAEFDADAAGEAAAKAVAAKQKKVGEVATYADLMEVQKNLDAQNEARLKAVSEALMASGKKEEKAAPEPAPKMIVFSPQANPDLFTGHITMTATIRNIGDAAATGVTANLTLLDPSGQVLMTKRLTQRSVDANGQWLISEGFDHMAGSELPRGTYSLQIIVDCANKPAAK